MAIGRCDLGLMKSLRYIKHKTINTAFITYFPQIYFVQRNLSFRYFCKMITATFFCEFQPHQFHNHAQTDFSSSKILLMQWRRKSRLKDGFTNQI